MMAFSSFTLRKLLDEHGTNVTLRKRVSGAYDVSTGSVTQTNTDYSVRAYFYDFTPDMLDGDSIRRGDRRVVVSPYLVSGGLTPEPDTTDQILGVGEPVNIVRVTEIRSADQILCYLLQVRE